MYEIVMEGITATIIGMGLVFAVLALLSLILYFFKYLDPQIKPSAQAALPEPVMMDEEEISEEPYDGTELIAVISAALAAYMGEGAPALAIKSIKPVGSAYRAWNVAAIRENHRGLY